MEKKGTRKTGGGAHLLPYYVGQISERNINKRSIPLQHLVVFLLFLIDIL